jgi:hypothetical protein
MDVKPTFFREKIGVRWWSFAVVQDAVSANDIEALLESYQDEVDLILIMNPDQSVLVWKDVARDDDWGAVFVPDPGRFGFNRSLGNSAVVIGKRSLLTRFLSLVGFNYAASERKETEEPKMTGRYPNLPNPGDVPRFQEESRLDPLGQNPSLRSEAWSFIACQLGLMMKDAHQHRLAMTLPDPEPGQDDPTLKAWRATAPLDASIYGIELLDVAYQAAKRHPSKDQINELALNVFQRYLLTMVALSTEEKSREAADKTAELVKHLGYLLVSIAADINQIPELAGFASLGRYAALLHSHQFIHGDMHLGNFSYDPETQKTISFDFGDSCHLERPLTALERARDLAILKLNCEFEQWEAVKMGYREVAKEQAEEVFQLI